MKIFVIGSGSWGSALAQICVDNGHDVLIYGNCADEINEINEYHTNSKYFPNVKLNENLKGTLNLEDVKDADCVIVAVAHSEFKALSIDEIKKLFKVSADEEKVLIDVKGIFAVSELKNSGLKYWRL